MPDWFYRTVSRPILFRLGAERGRDVALGFMGLLCRLPLGPQIIDFMGHMRADPRLARTVLGVTFPSPVGLGCALDARGVALPALARFGVGFLDFGPVTVAGSGGEKPLRRLDEQQALWRPDPPATLPLGEAIEKLGEVKGQGIPLIVRLAAASGATPEQAEADLDHLTPRLAELADVLALEGLARVLNGQWSLDRWRSIIRRVVQGAGGKPVLLVIPAELQQEALQTHLTLALEEGIAGVMQDGSQPGEGGRVHGLPVLALAVKQVEQLRRDHPGLPIIASGGIHEPAFALEMLNAGANLLATDTGLIFTGPGLPKRINEAVLYAGSKPHSGAKESHPQPPLRHGEGEARPESDRIPERSWFWMFLMGLGMLLGSAMALIIASTRIVMPYDETFSGMTREKLDALNPRLLLFLAHDRVSVAGTMIAMGVLYTGLSLFAIRRGVHWAFVSVLYGAFAGSATFLLFLGYGYLDPFHAFTTAILFQFLLLSLHSRLGPAPIPRSPTLYSGWRWRLSLWGQAILIGHAVAVILAGCVIASFGITVVFVHEDLEFMQTTAEELKAANPLLLPLIAHDRASFGGALVSVGLTLLMVALWGYRPCSAWLWWTLLLAVAPAYTCAITVHWVVGYTDTFHLMPAYGGLALSLLGLALSWPYLCYPGASDEEWQRFRITPAR